MVNSYYDTGEVPDVDPSEDPFCDDPQPVLIGQGYLKLEPLAYILDNPFSVTLFGSTHKKNGKLEINILPVDENGHDEYPEDNITDDPKDLSKD